eukprot:c15043_g1_i1 orf=148-975(+)
MQVPGKTAKECFDHFYSAYPTPVPQPRARRCHASSPIKPASSDGSLSPAMSTVKHSHTLGRGKRALLEAHRTVRQILRRQQTADEGFEADAFTAVETANPSLNAAGLVSPVSRFGSRVALSMATTATAETTLKPAGCGVESERKFWKSRAKTKLLSVFADLTHSITDACPPGQLQSPEVLKKESNPERLDRYLDILHLRRIDSDRSSFQKANVRTSTGKHANKDWVHCGVQVAKAAVACGAKEIIQTVLNRKLPSMETENMALDEGEDNISFDLE